MPFAVVFPSGDGKLSVIWFGELWESNEIIPTGSNYQQPQWTTNIYTSHIPAISTLSNLWNILRILDFMGNIVLVPSCEPNKIGGGGLYRLGESWSHWIMGTPLQNNSSKMMLWFFSEKQGFFLLGKLCQPTCFQRWSRVALNVMNTRKLTSNQYNRDRFFTLLSWNPKLKEQAKKNKDTSNVYKIM